VWERKERKEEKLGEGGPELSQKNIIRIK